MKVLTCIAFIFIVSLAEPFVWGKCFLFGYPDSSDDVIIDIDGDDDVDIILDRRDTEVVAASIGRKEVPKEAVAEVIRSLPLQSSDVHKTTPENRGEPLIVEF